MENNHSILPPSSAGIWGTSCTGWVKMVSTLPVQEDTAESLEGDLAHDKASRELKRASGKVFGAIPMPGDVKNGVVVTEEMEDAVKIYVEDVLGAMVKGYLSIGIEDKIEIPDIHPQCFGTADFWIFNDGALRIWDFKYGHKYVKVENNKQLICYAVGLIRRLELPMNTPVELTIVQPRTYTQEGPVRRWNTTVQEVWTQGQILSANAHRNMGPNGTLTTGPHCYYCKAHLNCGPAINLSLALIEMMGEVVPVEITPVGLGKQMEILDRAYDHIKSMRDATAEQIKVLLRKGAGVPGWCLESTFGREAWNKSEEEIFHLGELLGKNIKTSKPITPAQARKIGIPAEVVAMYSHRPNSGLKLTRDEGKAARIFGGN